MRTNSVSAVNFNGIYKLKLTNNNVVNKSINDFISEHEYVTRKTGIFQEKDNNYLYAITKDGTLEETLFEKDLQDIKVPFWKSLPINSIINKNMVDTLFALTEKHQGKENWII